MESKKDNCLFLKQQLYSFLSIYIEIKFAKDENRRRKHLFPSKEASYPIFGQYLLCHSQTRPFLVSASKKQTRFSKIIIEETKTFRQNKSTDEVETPFRYS